MTKSITAPEVTTFKFSAVTNYEISKEDLINLLITSGQGISYWGQVYVNFEPNKPYTKGYLKIEREGGIYINTNNLNYSSGLFCLDYNCFETDEKPEIINTKSIKDFIDTFKNCLENPNINSELKTNIMEALSNKDYGCLDAADMDYIMQKCIFGSCVYG